MAWRKINYFLPIKNNKNIIFRNIITTNELIIHNSDNGITTFGFNNPKRRNSLNFNMIKQLDDGLSATIKNDKSKVLIIHSHVPGIFCAGADLKERVGMNVTEIPKHVTKLRNLMTKIENVPIPVIVAIDGVALGGGLELSLAADIRIASSNAKLGLVETRLGIIPGAGGTQRLPRLINPAIAKEMIYTAKIIDGKKAEQIGLVNYCLEQNSNGDSAYLKALDLAEVILTRGPIAVSNAKCAINKGLKVDLNIGLMIEENCYSNVVPTKDRLEGLNAFLEKRPPKYEGK